MVTHNLEISGFHCPACAKLARLFLSKIEGIEKVDVHDDGSAEVTANMIIGEKKFVEALDKMDGDYKLTSYIVD